MSYTAMGPMAATVTVSREPDRSGNFICDGTADQVEIQAAVDYVYELGGGNVFLGTGVYDITAWVDFTFISNVRVAGANWGATELRASAALTRMFRLTDGADGGSHLTFENLFFNGNGNTDVLVGTEVPNSTDMLTVKNCVFLDSKISGLYNGNPTEVSGCQFYGHDQDAINADGGYVWRIHDCTFEYNFNSIDIQSYSYALVENCQFYQDANYMILTADDTAFIKINNVIMDGNNVTLQGMHINSQGASITGFEIRDCVNYGINFGGLNSVVDGGFIDGEDTMDIGIYTSGETHNTISNMNIIGCTVGGIGSAGSTYVTLDGNTLMGNEYAVNFWGSGVDYWTFGDNDFSGNTSGVCNNTDAILSNCRLPSKPFQFIKEMNGVYRTAPPTGVEVNAATEAALLQGHIPSKMNQVVRLRVYAVALGAPVNAGGQMHVDFGFNAGASNLAYNTAAKSWALASHDSEEADYVANDVVSWVIEDADVGDELVNLVALDKFDLSALHRVAADPDGETNAVFGSMSLEYI